ncbi:Conserved oligomeric Golgi complex subunit 3 [Gryllus bimaculatus]|nr:Conserved oligomeric Golgi complex subunit 3 [Gryllus bimaculatus]
MAENVEIKKIQDKLLKWEQSENSLAPLTSFQRHAILEVAEEINSSRSRRSNSHPEIRWTVTRQEEKPLDKKTGEIPRNITALNKGDLKIETTHQFLTWYTQVEEELLDEEDELYLQYYEQLRAWRLECATLLEHVEAALGDLSCLSGQYLSVSERTSSLHRVSEQLLAEQTQLHSLSEEVSQRLRYFTLLENLTQRLGSPTLSVASDQFYDLLDQLDSCIQYMSVHSKWREADSYLAKYRHCLSKALGLVRVYVLSVFLNATQQVLAPRQGVPGQLPADQVFALCYGKFQASATRLKGLLTRIEERCDRSQEHELLLADCLQCYFEQRDLLLAASVRSSVAELAKTHHGDHCSLVRSGCAFLVHVCQDEHQLFFQFFSRPASQLTVFLEGLCTSLYDTLRPIIIHINHLETLAEVCSILRLEMLEEHVQNNSVPLEAFGRIAWQLLHDVQERLVFRTHCYLQSDILNYKPAPGDLAYPEKLEMMESIAQQLQEQAALQAIRRSESHSSLQSVGSTTSQEVAHFTADTTPEQPRSRTGNSPADLHGMWYPTVRRTLVCLSRLYRCVDRPIFQGLSQEALSMCIQSVAFAATAITSRKGAVDGLLFQVKHLLILREQIAPFQVDFTVKEMSLDFSKVKTAAVREQLLDSRKEVDRTLKQACETFIKHSTNILAQPLLSFLDKAQVYTKMVSEVQGGALLSNQPFASASLVCQTVQETQRLIKAQLPVLQRSMQLYLANRETEFVLFRPIKNSVVGAFAQLQQLLSTGGYSSEDLLLAACPAPEQVALLLSSAALAASSAPPSTPRSTFDIASSTGNVTLVTNEPSLDPSTPHDSSAGVIVTSALPVAQ